MQTISANALKHLKFQLYPETKAMLPIKQITEVLKIQLAQIMPIPQMPAWVMGVYNWRGDILWMLDLGQLLGLDSWYQQQHDRLLHTAIVLSPEREGNNDNQIHLGLVVARVDDLEACDPAEIQAAFDSQIDSRLNRFLQGYWPQSSGEMVLALDGQAIASAMPRSPD
jgi:positive phototaxis protein PixI